MKYSKIILVLFIGILSCQGKKTKVDPFYTDKGGLDYVRIPLIKPYAIKCLSKSTNWVVSLFEIKFAIAVNNVKKANVHDNLILLYSNNSHFNLVNVKELWVIIVPDQHIEVGFVKHEDYLEYLHKLGIKTEPKLYSMDKIANYSEWHDTINWKAIDN